jgi:FkbM family methyltransferase
MFAIKYLLKEPFRILFDPIHRKLWFLMWRIGSLPRYQKTSVHFNGYKLQVPDSLSFLFQVQEIFVNEFYRFSAKTDSPIILDCGANIGSSILYFKSIYPKATITAFEADASIAQILETNLQANNVSNVTVVNKAVWVHNNGIEFATEGSDGASVYGAGAKTLVPSFRLKEELQKHPTIDMLKIDIEAAENDVIIDCKDELHRAQNIFLEYHSLPGSDQKLGEMLQILSNNGFRYFVNSAVDRKSPFVNHRYKNNDTMDLQLNIFAYKI